MVEQAGPHGHALLALSREQADLRDPAACALAVRSAEAVDLVVVAAAWTAVDEAEDNVRQAHLVNAAAPGAIAAAAAARGVPVVQISTDYVFDGRKASPYTEADPVAPVNAYGRTKLDGEMAVAAVNPEHVILRTAWVYSQWGGNFVRTMLRLAESRDEISVVDDQWGNPTTADDIASAILAVADAIGAGRHHWGVYHFGCAGFTTWARFARAVFEIAGKDVGVVPIESAGYPTRAARPGNSRLDCARILQDFGISGRPWRTALTETLQKIGATE